MRGSTCRWNRAACAWWIGPGGSSGRPRCRVSPRRWSGSSASSAWWAPGSGSRPGRAKVEAEARYFLTSCGDDPAVLARAIRRHWAVENALHWVLDVTFREDDSRVRDRTAARNLALLRKIALNLVAKDRSSRASLRGRRK